MPDDVAQKAPPQSNEVRAVIEAAREQPVPVIVQGRADPQDPEAVAESIERIQEAARRAGVESIRQLGNLPILVMEDVSAEQLETIWASGTVKSFEIDEAEELN
jgi:hypothetical protein